MNDCIFCEIATSKKLASIVYRDTRCTAFMDIKPINPGHVLIIPNDHAASLNELDEVTGGHIFQIAQKITRALYNSPIKCEGITYYLADGEAANQEIFHVHLHVFPRFIGDEVRLKVPSSYYTKHTEQSELDNMSDIIKEYL
ncbi:MAG: HIT family protein [Candidatus Aminicenantaceae bacterium]